MLKSLKTTNFRKLEANHIEFEQGMVVVRGANEAGKTSILEAIAYALFGVKSCRGSLADVVTWGKPENTLAVELIVTCEGSDYTIKRSKAGAEINYEGGKVTGQNECSAFVERLFGVTNGNAGKLIYGSQGDIRGALSQGPKATMELIENLANFDMLDNIVELVQANLVTGPTAASEAVLQAADIKLQEVKSLVVEPDFSEWEKHSKRFQASADVLTADLKELEEPLTKARKLLDLATAEMAQQAIILNEVSVHEGTIVAKQTSLAKFDEAIALRPDNETITKAELDYADALNNEARVKEHTAMTKLMMTFPEEFWEGSEASLDEEIQGTRKLIDKIKENIATNVSDMRLFESQKVTGSVCGFCNQDVSKFPEIEAKNAALDSKFGEAAGALAALRAGLADKEGDLELMADLKTLQSKFMSMTSQNVQANTNQVPASLSWVGEVPVIIDSEEVQSKKELVAEFKQAAKAGDEALVRQTAAKELIEELQIKVTELKAELATLKMSANIEAITVDYNNTYELHADYTNKLADAQFQVGAIADQIKREQAVYDSALGGVESAQNDVTKAKKAVDDLVFNNALVKRLRAARPIIADRLWNVVLGAVSSYFSAMRGFTSCVTKESDGFKVDGQSVEGLSGSTLDILGLSIRLALTRTFLPSAPFLILDEPSAAMDDKRSQEMVGFLLAFGFTQTLMVTHKEVNEGAANQLIVL